MGFLGAIIYVYTPLLLSTGIKIINFTIVYDCTTHAHAGEAENRPTKDCQKQGLLGRRFFWHIVVVCFILIRELSVDFIYK